MLEAVPAGGRGQHSEAPKEGLVAWLEGQPLGTYHHGEHNFSSHPPVLSPTRYSLHGHIAAIDDNTTQVWLARHIGKAQGERVL